MQAGRLRHVITIEQAIESQDATGAVVTTWETWADGVRASIEDLSSRERETLSQIAGEVTTRFRIRFRPGITEKMRIRHVHENTGSPQVVDIYDINGITRDLATARRELQLLCTKRSAEGFRSDGQRA